MSGDRVRHDLPQPDPTLGPEQVIQIQLKALKRNDEPEPDSGIATVFAFASPPNRAMTGPLERFTQMLHNPLYAPMLHYRAEQVGSLELAGDAVQQSVMLLGADGQTAVYLFSLSRQEDGPYAGCWMTDGVMRTG
jgi:hypothetical protein